MRVSAGQAAQIGTIAKPAAGDKETHAGVLRFCRRLRQCSERSAQQCRACGEFA
jgi:hypothetical protein